jgi:hypothetical protein
MIGVLIAAVLYLCLFVSIELIARRTKISTELSRKLSHIIAGTSVAFLPYFLSFIKMAQSVHIHPRRQAPHLWRNLFPAGCFPDGLVVPAQIGLHVRHTRHGCRRWSRQCRRPTLWQKEIPANHWRKIVCRQRGVFYNHGYHRPLGDERLRVDGHRSGGNDDSNRSSLVRRHRQLGLAATGWFIAAFCRHYRVMKMPDRKRLLNMPISA